MTQRSQIIDYKRTEVRVAAGVWIALWVLTVVTWIYDRDGYSAGMPPIPSFIHLFLPLIAGALVVHWRAAAQVPMTFWAALKWGVIGGAGCAAIDFAALLGWSGILIALGKVSPDSPFTPWEAVGEAGAMGLAYVVVGLIQGGIGGMALALLHRRAPVPSG